MTNKTLMVRLVFGLMIVLQSCKTDPMAMAPYVSGYWEIEKVISKDGAERDYGINLVIDYFFLDDDYKGFRKKLSPQLDGSYATSDHKEDISLKVIKDELMISYSTPYEQWQETVTEANENRLVLENEQGLTYIYRPYQNLKIEE